MSDSSEYGRQMILKALERQDDQLVGEFDTTKGGPILNLLARSRIDAAAALDAMVAEIRSGAPLEKSFHSSAQKVAFHFALVEYAKQIHVAGNFAYQELKSDEQLAIKQATVLSGGGDTSFQDD